MASLVWISLICCFFVLLFCCFVVLLLFTTDYRGFLGLDFVDIAEEEEKPGEVMLSTIWLIGQLDRLSQCHLHLCEDHISFPR